jgi:hypothetical protein
VHLESYRRVLQVATTLLSMPQQYAFLDPTMRVRRFTLFNRKIAIAWSRYLSSFPWKDASGRPSITRLFNTMANGSQRGGPPDNLVRLTAV